MSTMTLDRDFDPGLSIRWHTLLGTIGLLVVIVGIGGWAATTDISGALIASGSVVVDSDVKKVQHLSGGVVGALNVQNGDFVHAGDVLVRLDETMLRANLGIVSNGLDELYARSARLESERDGLPEVMTPVAFTDRQSDPYVVKVTRGELRFATSQQNAAARQRL